MESPMTSRLTMLMVAGLSFPRAVAETLEGGISGFAARRGLNRTQVSMKLNGLTRWPDTAIVEALADEFGCDPNWIAAQCDRVRTDRAMV
jgi:hypothetical protein